MNPPIRLVIADDHVLVRQGIRAFLDTFEDLSIVGEAEDAAGATRLCAEQRPQVALVDLVMPGGGIAATRDIRAASPETQVIVITSFEDSRQILAAVQAGALSCLLKDIDAEGLADAVRQEHYVEDRFHVPVAMQETLAKALADAGAERFRLADDLARLLVSHAFLGQLDVNPLGSAPGDKGALNHCDFRAQRWRPATILFGSALRASRQPREPRPTARMPLRSRW